MSETNTVLVLSGDNDRGRDLVMILEFVGEEQVLYGDEAEAALADDSAREKAVVAVVNGEDANVTTAVEQVCKAVQGLPILLVGDPELGGLTDDCRARIIARMEWPLNYTKFVDSFYRAQLYREQFSRNRERGQQRGGAAVPEPGGHQSASATGSPAYAAGGRQRR